MEPVYDKGRRAFLIHGGSGSGNFGHGGRPGYEGGSAPGGEEIEPDPNIGTKVKEGHIPTTPLDKSPSMGEKPHPGAGDYTPKMHGGPGSGNFGHEGRPGEQGGSAPGGGGGPGPRGEGTQLDNHEQEITREKIRKTSDPVEKGGPGSGEFGKPTPDEVRRAETKITYHGTEEAARKAAGGDPKKYGEHGRIWFSKV